MNYYAEDIFQYQRLKTKEVSVGGMLLGNFHPIRMQTMTTTDTMDTAATVAQSIRCIEAGAELVRITAPSKNDAENLLNIKNELRRQGYSTPLVADIHFTPNAAEIAARIVEKVRVNPGNYADKKRFEQIEYTNDAYQEELDRIHERFLPLVKICKEYGTAMRIGTNHGSLSDRIMSRYGDTPIGMVESAMEFLRIARNASYHNIVLSMKASNPQVMVQAYRLLIQAMHTEFDECYPLHLGVTEAGDGEDGRIKSAVGIGTLLEDGIGDTIRVSLTEDPEFEIPVCRNLIKRYTKASAKEPPVLSGNQKLFYDPFHYKRNESFTVSRIGGGQVPVVIADLSKADKITPQTLEHCGYTYNSEDDKWHIADQAADFIFTGTGKLNFELPGTLQVITLPQHWKDLMNGEKYFPIYDTGTFLQEKEPHPDLNFVMLDADVLNEEVLQHYAPRILNAANVVLCLSSESKNAMQQVRRAANVLMQKRVRNPLVLITDSNWQTADEHLVHYATETGALLLDGVGDGICLGMSKSAYETWQSTNAALEGRRYDDASNNHSNTSERFLNQTAFGILQATRTRISKTEYISCPSCGRTLFDLQETTARIRKQTHHLKGVKIAIMGCIVNGPGEMADADFGYVGSGPGKITLYKGKEIVKRNVDSAIAVEELIGLLRENEVWIEP